MGRGEKCGRYHRSGESGTGKNSREDGLDKASIDEFFTNSDCKDKQESRPSLALGSWQEFLGKLRNNAAALVWECGDATDCVNLIEYQDNRHAGSGSQGPNRMQKGEAQGGPRQVMHQATPQNDCDSRPLKCDCR